jgi:hypothetical protein
MKFRPTILGFMGIIALIAVGMAALRSNDVRGFAAIFVLTVSALCTATLVAIYRRGAWAGFAVFGWAQFLICQPHLAPAVGPTSSSTVVVYQLLSSLIAETPSPFASSGLDGVPEVEITPRGDMIAVLDMVGTRRHLVGYVPIHSLRSCLCLSCMIVGLVGSIIGGLIAHSVARRSFAAGRLAESWAR